MDTYVHLLQRGDMATVMVTGTLTNPVAQYGRDELASMRLAGGRRMDLVLPLQPGVRVLAGDLAPTLVSALEDAIEHLGKADPEWASPETEGLLNRYERALDALRGGFCDEETSPARAS